jgi:membrane-bound metal-dependent hydrolase YbcI (DUF457 family)
MVGVSAALVGMPPSMSFWRWVLALNIFILMSYLPDLPLPLWGHANYFVSHSLFVNVLFMTACFIAWVAIAALRRSVPSRLFVAGIAAWGSHFLLDALYKGTDGVAVFWPFSDAVLNLPLPWFDYFVPSLGVFHAQNLRVFGIEAVAYLPILLIAVTIRVILSSTRLRFSV